ncbi:MAG: TauD/TfdA family dioxygenase [Rhodococcus sp. (in: high G+C Gram-positive bacteria)]|uniref:(3R)-3-[(carboxymethyl)amino]fatty acid oxygenase/decarboxylase n=1 Tax=Rhodococcus sp. TaxID=1831 RepID=UPI002ADBCB81|nr:TauD/TfdA family dioxygenase [Rhodococcus sp. (in: high G+C Gram-positive bacteria)]
MLVTPQPNVLRGIQVHGFDPKTASDADYATLRDHVYRDKIVLLKEQALSPPDFIALGREFGTPSVYYEPMYHHPEHDEIFVSSNVPAEGKPVGVPKTGKFWHSDYQFMPDPYAITLIYPQVLPSQNRGTYFIDMAQAYNRLDSGLKAAVDSTYSWNSSRRYVKIRPSDVYRPLGEIMEEVEEKTPAQLWPTVLSHPVTGESILYVTEAFTYAMEGRGGDALPKELLTELLEASGQLDLTFTHPNIFLQTYEPGDILLWDNRSLIHRALHTSTPEATVSFRVTVHDAHPLSAPTKAA